MWFRLLWQRYDGGGISVGRSARCDCLNLYLDFTPLPKYRRSIDTYIEGLEEELKRRPVLAGPRTQLYNVQEITSYTPKQLALAGLGALLSLEWSVHADVAWENGYERERGEILDVLSRFMYIEISPNLDIHLVIKMLLERRREIEYQQNKRRFQKPIL